VFPGGYDEDTPPVMAERSFTHEVGKLRLGAGQEFRGEGILAVTKALLQSGVGYVGGYQGAPISHLMDVLSDAQGLLQELGIHFEASASEAAAAAMLAASVNYPIRGAVTWKSTVGTNVASDALANVASGGVTGGALVIIGEDYGEGSSIMQERSHAFAMKSQMWLLDPRPNLESIVAMVERGFELSEASNTPVMLELRIRACHVYGSFIAHDNRAPKFTLQDALDNPTRDVNRIVLPPASFLHEQEKINQRWPAAVEYITERRLNEFLGGTSGDVGIILQGGLYNTLIRALELLGLADSIGTTELPLYVLNVTYPLIESEVVEFCRGKKAVLIVEEGQPEYLEQNLNSILRRADVGARVIGKDVFPRAGEYTGDVILRGVRAFMRAYSPDQLDRATPLLPPPPAEVPKEVQALAPLLPIRPAGFCTGCPERPIFTAMKLLQREIGQVHISCDIGCHLFSILPPFNIGNTTMGYGLGAAGASAFNTPRNKRAIAVMGDGGFWHNGLTSGVGNSVFNQSDNVLVVVDNGYSAATGGQDILSSRADNRSKSTKHPIAEAVKGVGVKWVRVVDRTYDVGRMRDVLREAMTTPEKGPKVVLAASECMLNRQRREKPAFNKAVASGARMVRERFGVDADTCTGDHSCIRLSGCPSLTIKPNPDPLRQDPIAHVENSCVGCGVCGEVAHAAVLCPSFYRAQIVFNPTGWDRMLQKLRASLIGFFQRRAERRRLRHAF
jgi:indolepyruvate ferredoxin oxidoreductase, alpha subunit